jgi:hypothetical protein
MPLELFHALFAILAGILEYLHAPCYIITSSSQLRAFFHISMNVVRPKNFRIGILGEVKMIESSSKISFDARYFSTSTTAGAEGHFHCRHEHPFMNFGCV